MQTGAGRDHTAIHPHAFGGIPFDDLGAAQDFELGLFERLALFERHRQGHLVYARTDQRGGFQDDLRARIGRGLAPDVEAALRGSQRIVEIGAGGMRHGAEHALVRGIDDRCARSPAPMSVYVKLDLWIGHSQVRFLDCWRRLTPPRLRGIKHMLI